MPAALPRIFVAFRLAAGIALIVAVTVEIAVNPLGLGAGIMTAQQALRPELMLAYLVWIGIVGYGAQLGADRSAQRRLFGRAALAGEPRMNRRELLWRTASFAVAAGFVALWQVIANLQAGLAGVPAGPGPRLGRAAARLRAAISPASSLGTLEHMAYGWLAASLAGIALGALIGSRARCATISRRRSNSCGRCRPRRSSPSRSRCSA